MTDKHPSQPSNSEVENARWRAVFQTARDAIISIDRTGLITVFNPAAEKMFGYTATEVIGHNVSILMAEPYRSEHDRYVADYHATGEPKAIGRIRQVEGRRRSGQAFPIELAVSESTDHGTTGYTAILRDVSRQKQLEEELRRERDFAKSLVDTAQMIFLVLDPDGRIAMFNPFMEELCGYALDEVVGKDWFETFLPDEYHASIRDVFRRTLDGTPVLGNVNPVRTRYGELRSIEWRGELLYNADGSVAGVLCSGIDITEHLATTERIRARELQQASIARLGRNALIASDPIAVIAAAVRMVRQTLAVDFAKVLELLPGDDTLRVVAGDGWNRWIIGEVVDPVRQSHAAETLRRKQPTPATWQSETDHGDSSSLLAEHGVISGLGVTIGGRCQPYGILAAYARTPHVFTEDEVTFVQAVANVIAEAIARNRTERELQAARQEAQQRDRLADIGAITAKVVHDLGNPLAALSMQSQLLLRKARRGEFSPVEPVTGPVEQSLSTLRRLQELIAEFNDFARDQRIEFASIHVDALLQSTAELWRPLATEHGADLSLAVADDLPAILGDEEKLRRVLDNLVKNAIEAIDGERGEIAIGARLLESGKIGIAVTDTGSGVPEGTDVFKLFETTKRDGTGIGLAVAKQIIQAHGGTIEHRQNKPHGTVFEIALPDSGPDRSVIQPLTP